MPKLLTKDEATEMINTMLDEYGLDRIVILESPNYWYAVDEATEERRFLWWKWKPKPKIEDYWIRDTSLSELVKDAEAVLLEDYGEEVEDTDILRMKHAARLLDKKLEE